MGDLAFHEGDRGTSGRPGPFRSALIWESGKERIRKEFGEFI